MDKRHGVYKERRFLMATDNGIDLGTASILVYVQGKCVVLQDA